MFLHTIYLILCSVCLCLNLLNVCVRVCVCMCVCVRACVRACVCACVRACVRACVCLSVCLSVCLYVCWFLFFYPCCFSRPFFASSPSVKNNVFLSRLNQSLRCRRATDADTWIVCLRQKRWDTTCRRDPRCSMALPPFAHYSKVSRLEPYLGPPSIVQTPSPYAETAINCPFMYLPITSTNEIYCS